MKKTIALVISFLLILSTITYAVAINGPTIEISNASAAPGEKVQLSLSLKNNPGINTFSLGFNYDTSRLKLDDVSLNDGIPGQFQYVKKAVWLNNTDTDYSGAYLILSFTVLETAQEGDASVIATYSAGDICDYDENDVNFDLVAGKVTVTSVQTEEPDPEEPAPEEPDVNAAKYEISSATALLGKAVTLYVSIENNPGIISLRNEIVYDESVMQLTSVKNLALLNGYTTPSATIASPYTLRWADSLSTVNNVANGRIVALTFTINEDAPVGNYAVTVNHKEARNTDGAKINFTSAQSFVTVIDVIKGDVDKDGEITDWDAILLNRYLADWDVDITEPACDIDEDGEITDWDAILLERYLAGWTIEELC